jgi:PPP family 3-phenylpropionic acid transporter
MALFSLFQIAIAPLSDAITLELASKGIVRFTSIRTFGSVGYAFISVLAGWLFTKHLELIFLVTSALMLGCFFLIFGIPKVAGHQSGTNKVKLIEMFKNRQLIVLYVYTLLHSISIGFLWAFQAIYGKEQGISMQVIGIGLAIGSFSQFPFMIFFQNLYDRFGIRKILLLSGMIHTVRWSLYAVGLTPFTYVLSWILHGGTYILFYLCLAEYVNKYVVKELKVSGQMLNSLIQLTMGSIVGGMLGGLYAARFGFQNAFLMLMLIGAVATAGFYLVSRRFHMFEHVRHTAVETRSISHTEESL